MARASKEFDDLPREHVVRPALPWRDEQRTECGLTADDKTLTRDDLVDKVRKQGQRRAQLTTCGTCYDTAQRWPDWSRNPSAVMARELKNVNHWMGPDEGNPINDELRVIAMLIQEHREEFDQALAALRSTVPFVRRRTVNRGRRL